MVGAGGMETWGGRRSAAYASMCGPLLPFLREGGPGAVTGTESRSAMFRFLPGSIRPGARVGESYLLTAFVHLPYSPTITPGDIGREKMPYGEYAAGRGEGSGPPHYSGIRFGLRFRGADPITSDQYCRVPRIRAAASGRVEP